MTELFFPQHTPPFSTPLPSFCFFFNTLVKVSSTDLTWGWGHSRGEEQAGLGGQVKGGR